MGMLFYCKRCDEWWTTNQCEACSGNAQSEGDMIDDVMTAMEDR